MMIPSFPPQHVGKTVLLQNSDSPPRFSGASENMLPEYSAQIALEPAQHSIGSRIAGLFQMLLPASLAAGGVYCVNNNLNNFTNTMTENMNVVKDSIIRGLPKETQESWVKSGFKWLGGLAITGFISYFAGSAGADKSLKHLATANQRRQL